MTSPAATVLLDCSTTEPTVKPALVIAELAVAWVSPTTLGTLTEPLPEPPPHAARVAAAISNMHRRIINARLLPPVFVMIPSYASFQPLKLRSRLRAIYSINPGPMGFGENLLVLARPRCRSRSCRRSRRASESEIALRDASV
jgi:hypothetical protein